tara:strand:+ start:5755 stop:6252 length:498 start_codon:yes stop_codon:yes gene_type:complete
MTVGILWSEALTCCCGLQKLGGDSKEHHLYESGEVVKRPRTDVVPATTPEIARIECKTVRACPSPACGLVYLATYRPMLLGYPHRHVGAVDGSNSSLTLVCRRAHTGRTTLLDNAAWNAPTSLHSITLNILPIAIDRAYRIAMSPTGFVARVLECEAEGGELGPK